VNLRRCASQQVRAIDFRTGSDSAEPGCPTHVRLAPDTGSRRGTAKSPFGANSVAVGVSILRAAIASYPVRANGHASWVATEQLPPIQG